MIEAFVVYSILLMIYLWRKAHVDNITGFDFWSSLTGIAVHIGWLAALITQ